MILPKISYKSQDCTGNLLLLHFSSNSNHDICIWQTQRYFSTIVPNLYNSQLPTASCSTFHSVEHISGLLNLDVRWSPSRQELWREGHALDSQLGHSFQDLASSIFFFFNLQSLFACSCPWLSTWFYFSYPRKYPSLCLSLPPNFLKRNFYFLIQLSDILSITSLGIVIWIPLALC